MDPASDTPPAFSPPTARSWRGLAFLICPVIGPVIGLLVALLVSYLGPKQFESRAVVQVGIRQAPSELSLLVSSELAEKVVKELDLATLWNMSEKEAASRVLENVAAEAFRGTDLIELRARASNRNDARDIAVAFLGGFVESRTEAERARMESAGSALEEELAAGEAELEKRRLDYLEAAVPFRAGESVAQEERFKIERERIIVEKQIKAMGRLKGEELRKYAAGTAEENNEAARVLEVWNRQRGVLATMSSSGLGASHPSLVRARERLLNLETELDNVIISLRLQKAKELERLNLQLKEIEQEGTGARGEEVEALREEYESARESVRNMKERASEQRILAKLPRNPVTVHELPALARQPISPRVPVNLAQGSAIGFLGGLLAAFPVALVRRRG